MSATQSSDDESRDNAASSEPTTLDACRADYEAGDADRVVFDRHTARYYSEWSK